MEGTATTTTTKAPESGPFAGISTQTTTATSKQGLSSQTTTMKEPTQEEIQKKQEASREYGIGLSGGAVTAPPSGPNEPRVEHDPIAASKPLTATTTTSSMNVPNLIVGLQKAVEQGPPMEYPTGLSGGAVEGSYDQQRAREADDARRERERDEAMKQNELQKQQSTGLSGGGVQGGVSDTQQTKPISNDWTHATQTSGEPLSTANATTTGATNLGFATQTANDSELLGSTTTRIETVKQAPTDDVSRRAQVDDYPVSSTARRF